jgi:hypothetical protein
MNVACLHATFVDWSLLEIPGVQQSPAMVEHSSALRGALISLATIANADGAVRSTIEVLRDYMDGDERLCLRKT